ncbi:MAG TPA: sigma-E factor regulatory protein RseB domain-containing protein [Trebonia sp.]|nr:sigma-E factor regulatory protein RseB domain-containing protein [Trebonia sp.]
MTAIATVTIPGLLAVVAAVGHERTAVPGVAAALEGTQLSGPFPVAPTTARAAVRDNVAAVQRVSGVPLTVLSRVTTSEQAAGMRLLDLAAKASLATSYQGTELASQSDVGGSVKVFSQVWHEGGGATLVETSDSAAAAPTLPAAARKAGADVTANPDPTSGPSDGVFGVTKDLLAQLGKHYVAVYQGHGSAAGKAASIVEVYRFDGSVAARYWLDRKTMVPLRRDLYDTSDKVISEDSFVQVQFGALTLQPQAAEAEPAQSAWAAAGAPATYLTSLTGQGLRVPATMPGGLPLYKAASTRATSGEIVDLEYSDGLYVVSLFVERGTLSADMPGWRKVSVAGQQAYVSGHSVTWAGPGYVYTVIADAPPQTVTQVVQALPRGGAPGVLDRLGRGFLRLARVINPFG